MRPAGDIAVGDELLGYRIEALIGRGGMGVVYRAYDPRLKRSVALKLVGAQYAADERFRARFLHESELAASLEHPNVVPVHDAGEADGRLFIVMRYVEGRDLRQLLRDGALSPERAVAVCSQIASALDAAHERGLVHRDVKPSNVLVDVREHCYLADFGLTRRLSEQAPGYDAGLSMGTPAYVAPEQIEGAEVDGRADQYSLACLLFECLKGEPPFRRDSDAAVLFAHLDEKPPTLPGLEDVLPRALAKDPAGRYSTCRELVEAARTALGVAEPPRPPGSRAPVVVALAAAAILAASLLAFFLVRGDGSSPATASHDSVVRIDPGTGEVVARIPVGRNPSAVAAGAGRVWVASLDDGSVSRIDPRTNRVELQAPIHGAPTDLAVSGRRVIVAGGPAEGKVSLVNAATGVEESGFSVQRGRFFGSPSVSASGPAIWVATGDRRVGRLNVLTGELIAPVRLPQPPADRAESIFSGIAAGDDAVWVIGDPLEHRAWRVDPSDGKLVATVALPFAPKDLAVGEGGVWVTSQVDDTVSRIDPATNALSATIAVGKGAAGVAVGAGSVWVANSIDGTVSRIDPRTLKVETIGAGGYPDDVVVDGDGVWVTAHAAGPREREDALTIGVLAPCKGTYGYIAPISYAGAELPLLERGATLAGAEPADGVVGSRVGGKDVELVFGCGDDSAEKALSEARRLVEVRGADVVVGSYFPGESLAVRDYARTQPGVAFVGGVGMGQEVTLRRPAPNYFRFLLDGAQIQAGVGRYAHDELGWRRVVTVADALGFDYTQIAGFVAEFCALGGEVVKEIWVPVGTADPAAYVRQVPRAGVDGIVMSANPPTALPFLRGVPQLKRRLADRLIGSIGLTVPPIPETLGRKLDGVVFGAPDDTETPAAKAFDSRFSKAFPRLAGQGFFFGAMYADAVDAVLRGLEVVDGDLSGGERRFQEALASLELDTPTTGHIRLDSRRQAVGPAYLIQFVQKGGHLGFRTLSVARDVEETFGGYFPPDGPAPRTNSIPCKHGNPPPWARSG